MPSNAANTEYSEIVNNYAEARDIDQASTTLDGMGLIGGRDYEALGNMLEKLAILTKDVNVTMTVSADPEELPAKVKAFLK